MGKLSRYILKGMSISQGRFFVASHLCFTLKNVFGWISPVPLRFSWIRKVLWDRLKANTSSSYYCRTRLTSNETCYLYGRLTSYLRYVQAQCPNQWHFWNLAGVLLRVHPTYREITRVVQDSIKILFHPFIHCVNWVFLAYFEKMIVASYPG